MTGCCYYQSGTVHRNSPARRWFRISGSVLPGALAVILPKCPLCIAAWLAASTGVALPAIFADSIRPALVIASVVSVALLIRRALHFRGRSERQFTSTLIDSTVDFSSNTRKIALPLRVIRDGAPATPRTAV
jgi:hypothetical protein